MITTRSWRRLLPWMTAFAVAMAFLESAVVIDLRALYYTDGFSFPLVVLDRRIAATELLRELATLVMLVAVGALVAQRRLERFAWTCYCFAVWDVFYYVFLKAILGWPVGLLTWDVLFLLPVVWVGPVLAPCLVSVGLILLAWLILHNRERDAGFRLAGRHWALLLLGGAVILYAFMEEPVRHLRAHGALRPDMALNGLRDYVPQAFAWPVFLTGLGLGALVLTDLLRRRG